MTISLRFFAELRISFSSNGDVYGYGPSNGSTPLVYYTSSDDFFKNISN
jgi:hypothetical protein